MKVLIVASEAVPFAKTGGLADVVGALPQYLKDFGVETETLIPKYKGIKADRIKKINIDMQGPIDLNICRQDDCLFVEYPRYFARNDLYGDSKGDYPDNCERFTLFCKAATKLIRGSDYDIVHCHDWQSGLVPLYMKQDSIKARSMFTIHNLGYQGKFPKDKFPLLGLDKSYFVPQGLEFFGNINLLKAGIVYSDMVTTVSESYAREIQSPELGFGLDGVLRLRSGELHGIINGIDYAQWNPESDELLYEKYSDFAGKQVNKAGLCLDHGLDAKRPLIGMVSRIAEQKGFDILVSAMDEIINTGFNVIILGYGDESYHVKLEKLADVYYNRMSINIRFDNRLAHRIYAGSDFFLMPSMYEPCGLGQLISLRYGTVPIVRSTGGLADTVIEFDHLTMSGNGFLFTEYSGRALVEVTWRAYGRFDDARRFKRLSENCMRYDYSWGESAKKYKRLYKTLLNP